MTIALRSLGLLSLFCLASIGCHVDTHNDGKSKNVDINTPFGSMQVKTHDSAALAKLGLTPYPGATPYTDDSNDNDRADVNMSFGNFHLGVQAASYKTNASQGDVLAFYKKDMSRYGEVLTCRDKQPVGQPTRTAQGLTCNDDANKGHAHSGDEGLELRAGSPQHQHIVALDPKDGFLKLGLVALDLPGDHDHTDSE